MKMSKFFSVMLFLAVNSVNAQTPPAKLDGDYKSGDLTVESGTLKQAPLKLNADFTYVKRNDSQDGAGVRFEFNKKLHLAPFDSEAGNSKYCYRCNQFVDWTKKRFSVIAIAPDLKLDLQTKGKDISRLDLSGAQVSLVNFEMQAFKDADQFYRGKVPAENLNQTLSVTGPSAIAIFKNVKDIGLSQKGVQFSAVQVTYHGSLKIAGVNFDGCIGLNPINATAGKVEGRGSEEGLDRMNSKIIACAGVNLGKVAHVGYQFGADLGWDGSRTLSHEVTVSKIGHDKNPVRITGASRTDTNANGLNITTHSIGIGASL